MTEIMPVPRKIILLSYQQGANARVFYTYIYPSSTSLTSITQNPTRSA